MQPKICEGPNSVDVLISTKAKALRSTSFVFCRFLWQRGISKRFYVEGGRSLPCKSFTRQTNMFWKISNIYALFDVAMLYAQMHVRAHLYGSAEECMRFTGAGVDAV